MENRYLSVKELAEYMGFNEQTIYHWIAQRKIPFYKIGKAVRFSVNEIQDWVNKYRKNCVFDFNKKI